MAVDIPQCRGRLMRKSFAHFPTALHAPSLALAMLLAGCASLPPPTAELDLAQRALAAAERADADQYAPELLEDARRALQQAQAAMSRGRDPEAREAALAASAAADLARVQSGTTQLRAEYRQRQADLAQLRARLQLDDAPGPANPLEIPVDTAPAAQRLLALESDTRLNPFAQYERSQARQALLALDSVSRRDLDAAMTRAERRVAIAEHAARIEAARREIDRLDRVHSELLVEASRRDAEQARAEAERLRLEAQVRAEEAARLRAQAEQAEAALDGAQLQQDERVAAARRKEADLARQEAELVAGAKLPPMRQAPQGELFTLAGEAFASGQASLTPAAAASIKALGLYLAALPGGAVQVLGHTDSQGEDAANLALSERRAQQVRASLAAAGVERGRITAQGMGETRPVADNATAAGRAKNRRVEILVAK